MPAKHSCKLCTKSTIQSKGPYKTNKYYTSIVILNKESFIRREGEKEREKCEVKSYNS